MRSGAMQIGALAKRTGLSIDAIRFYEKQQLIQSPRRSQGGFRLFGNEQLSTLHFIKSAQELGFPLDEIRELLKLRSDTVKACPTMKAILQAKLATVEGKIESLDTLRAELKAALHKCDTKLKASSGMTSEGCPVLADISKAT